MNIIFWISLGVGIGMIVGGIAMLYYVAHNMFKNF